MAQCEARFDCCQWVRTLPGGSNTARDRGRRSQVAQLFLTLRPALALQQVNRFLPPHLQIEPMDVEVAQAMSRRARGVETYSARQIRFLFLLHRYHEPMEYSANAMSAAVDLERRFASFDSNLAARLADAAAADAAAAVGAAPPHEHKWGAEERVLQAAFAEKRATVHAPRSSSR